MAKKTLAAKIGVSQKVLSNKIAEVRRDNPSLTKSQAAGKAAGIEAEKRGRHFYGRKR